LGRTRRQLELVEIERDEIVEEKTQIQADLELLAGGRAGERGGAKGVGGPVLRYSDEEQAMK
jgi:hypothetical protein